MASTEDKAGQEQDQSQGFWKQFQQQRLRAWQPSLSPSKVILFYIVWGLLFLLAGIGLLLNSRSIVEYVADYSEIPLQQGLTDGAEQGVGNLTFTVDRDMTPPIFLYYQLQGFHQNHRSYVKSRVDAQLNGAKNPNYNFGDTSRLADCKPALQNSESPPRTYFPCGLVARSVFNDSFTLIQQDQSDPSGWSPISVDSRATTIAWKADTDSRFVNLNPENNSSGACANQIALDMWILRTFPPVRCDQIVINDTRPFRPVEVATTVKTCGVYNVTVPDCTGYQGNVSCNFVQDGKPFQCKDNYQQTLVQNWGVESGHFIVWMRVAGLPTFRKLWGKIDKKISAGTKIQVHIQSRFPVTMYYGRKSIVLTTTSPLGGRNDFLGIGYIAVGSFCLIFGGIFLIRNLARLGPSPAVADQSGS